MNQDLKTAIFDSLKKYSDFKITPELLELMSQEANLTLKRIHPGFGSAHLLECYYVESEGKIKFLVHKVH
jgi:hypothetical protein